MAISRVAFTVKKKIVSESLTEVCCNYNYHTRDTVKLTVYICVCVCVCVFQL